jgi:hypothetical protein
MLIIAESPSLSRDQQTDGRGHPRHSDRPLKPVYAQVQLLIYFKADPASDKIEIRRWRAATNQEPYHLNRRARTERLYGRPLNDGLWVEPVNFKEEGGGVETPKVAVMPPCQTVQG